MPLGVHFRAGVEDFDTGDLGRLFEAEDHFAFGVIARITLAGHDHADGGARVPLQLVFGEVLQSSFDSGQKQVAQVRLEPHQHGLSLRIAEAAIVFQNAHALVGCHDTRVENPAEGDAAAFHGVDGGDQGMRLDVIQ